MRNYQLSILIANIFIATSFIAEDTGQILSVIAAAFCLVSGIIAGALER